MAAIEARRPQDLLSFVDDRHGVHVELKLGKQRARTPRIRPLRQYDVESDETTFIFLEPDHAVTQPLEQTLDISQEMLAIHITANKLAHAIQEQTHQLTMLKQDSTFHPKRHVVDLTPTFPPVSTELPPDTNALGFRTQEHPTVNFVATREKGVVEGVYSVELVRFLAANLLYKPIFGPVGYIEILPESINEQVCEDQKQIHQFTISQADALHNLLCCAQTLQLSETTLKSMIQQAFTLGSHALGTIDAFPIAKQFAGNDPKTRISMA